MFRRSIRENIIYGHPEVTEAKLEQVLHDARLHAWTNTLPNGVDTVLDEREKQLSGGQRQRLQLARAFLSSKRIVLLVSVSLYWNSCGLNIL